MPFTYLQFHQSPDLNLNSTSSDCGLILLFELLKRASLGYLIFQNKIVFLVFIYLLSVGVSHYSVSFVREYIVWTYFLTLYACRALVKELGNTK